MKFEKLFLIGIILLASFLRLYKIDVDPPGLYIDEVSIGYNAYQILTTGKDEYGIAHPLWFRSFGDYKMPVYIYAVAASMAVFGKNEFAVRFPSALGGILSILVIYYLVKVLTEIDKSNKIPYKKYLPLLSSFLLAISSWHVHFSRGGFEVNLGLFFYLCGVLAFLYYFRDKKPWLLFTGVVIFVISMYTYHSFRVIAPLSILLSLAFFYHKLKSARKIIIVSFIVFILLCIPIFQFSLTKEGSERFAQTSAFSEYPTHSFLEKLAVYPMVYLKDYLSYFSFNFLFNFGDGIGRHQIANFGLFYHWEFIFLLLGIYFLARQKKSYLFGILVGMLLLAVVPAALSRPSPHSLRSILMVVPLTIIIALGVLTLSQRLKKYIVLFGILLFGIIVYELLYTVHFYTDHYPKINALDWGASYKAVVLDTEAMQKNYDAIVVDSKLADIKTYFNFYDPDIHYTIVDSSWTKPESLKNKKVLYIRPYYGAKTGDNIIKNVTFPYNSDIFAQFWKV